MPYKDREAGLAYKRAYHLRENIGQKTCDCGCGKIIPAISRGKARKFALGHNGVGEMNCNYNGGITMKDGYILRNVKGKRIPEQRIVYEEYYKCCLLDITIIHHKNQIKTDNRIENLEPMYRDKHIDVHRHLKN